MDCESPENKPTPLAKARNLLGSLLVAYLACGFCIIAASTIAYGDSFLYLSAGILMAGFICTVISFALTANAQPNRLRMFALLHLALAAAMSGLFTLYACLLQQSASQSSIDGNNVFLPFFPLILAVMHLVAWSRLRGAV